jgi:hypothetical protein
VQVWEYLHHGKGASARTARDRGGPTPSNDQVGPHSGGEAVMGRGCQGGDRGGVLGGCLLEWWAWSQESSCSKRKHVKQALASLAFPFSASAWG